MNSDGKHILCTIGSFLCVVIVGSALLVVPTRRNLKAVHAETTQLRDEVTELAGNAERVQSLQAELDAARDRVAMEFKVIPDSPHVADLMRQLSLSVDGANVRDQTFTAGVAGSATADGTGTALALPLRVEMEAQFDSVFAVIRRAEAIENLIRVASVEVSANRDRLATADQPLVTASIRLEALYDPRGSKEVP